MRLVIAEKPKVAQKIANSLGKPKKITEKKVHYYVIDDIVVASTVGHMYGLKGKTSTYPNFDLKWVPQHTLDKKSSYMKAYIGVLKKLSRKAQEIVNACDYDVEGAVIGFNVARFACNFDLKKVKRMKFSTLTKDELQNAYKNLMDLDYGMIDAGITRHKLDWFWGMNTSVALTSSVKKASGFFKLLSAGRVQTPTLHFLVEREKEIQNFVPKPYWELAIDFEKDSVKVTAEFEEKIFEKEKALKIYRECLGKNGIVTKIEKKRFKRNPPVPFDLGLLQRESYKNFGFSPRKTQNIAQSLYEAGLISYPRTSSQKLPPSLPLRSIVEKISKNPKYREHALEILKTPLIPNNGKKDDPAHPAIYPTGELLERQTKDGARLYDLIVSRFFATFAEPAVNESKKVEITVSGYPFYAKGKTTVFEGFLKYYHKYVGDKDVVLPEFFEGEEILIDALNIYEKETKPPPRYNPSSVLKMMEKLGIGTKGTRAQILDILYERRYIVSRQIRVTELGMKIIEALEEYCGEIVSQELTRHFERKMEEIRKKKKTKEEVIEEAKKTLIKIFDKFRKNEEKIGEKIVEALKSDNIIGKCECGGDLKILRAKKSKKRFIGCSNYPKCKKTYPLYQRGKISATNKICKNCGLPIVKIDRFEMCINPECFKRETLVLGKCPLCGNNLQIMFSRKLNRSFVGCSGYPNCKNAFSLPKNAKVEATGEVCGCGLPIVVVNGEERCLDSNCSITKILK